MDAPPRLADSLSHLLMDAARLAHRAAAGPFGGEALRFPHYVVACFVEADPGIAQAPLADAVGVDPSDLTRLVAALEDAGLLTRRADAEDRRRRTLTLTDAGRSWVQQRHAAALAFEADLLAPCADDGRALRAALTEFVAAHREAT